MDPGWLGGQCKKAGIPEDVALRFVAGLSNIFGAPVHDKYSDSLAGAAAPAEVEEAWDVVSDRIEELAQEILTQLE